MQWQLLTFSQLDAFRLYQLLQLRVDVFVVEQQCPYPELDGKDLLPDTHHLLLYKEQKLMAYARLLAPGVSFDGMPAIGRICVAQDARRLGLGVALVQQAIDQIQHIWPGLDIAISAQCYLQKFYEDQGFQAISTPYLEDDIPHISMQRVHSA